jgi:hypothetical protein
MNNILNLIDVAVNATDEPCSLRVELIGNDYCASIVADDGEVITLQSDWDVQLIAKGNTLAAALAALDAICVADFN